MQELVRRRIWDPLIRVWHWLFASAVCAAWALGEFMSFESVRWHFYLGYCVLGLIALRIVWGLIGPAPVRLAKLLPDRQALKQSLRELPQRKPSGIAGHNPLGSLSVIAMLLVICAQACIGLFIGSEDFFEYGPLAEMVSDELATQLLAWHHRLAKLILALLLLHLMAIAYYRFWKRENLIWPMISGWKWVKRDE